MSSSAGSSASKPGLIMTPTSQLLSSFLLKLLTLIFQTNLQRYVTVTSEFVLKFDQIIVRVISPRLSSDQQLLVCC